MPSVEFLEVPQTAGLDAITVYWHNYQPGKGMVTLTCWGAAWSAYFGAMGSDNTIQSFFAGAGVDYLVNKLTDHQFQKLTKKHEQYLAKLVSAIKSQLKTASADD